MKSYRIALALFAVVGLSGCGGNNSTNVTTFTVPAVQTNAISVVTGNSNGTITQFPVNLATADLSTPTLLPAINPPVAGTDVGAVVLSPDHLTLFVADFSVPAESGTITPFLVDSQTGALSAQNDNSFNGFSGAPQTMVIDPTGQFLFVGQEDGTVQVVDVTEGAVIGLQANNDKGGVGQVNTNGEAKTLALATVGSNEVLMVGEGSTTLNLQTFLVETDGTLAPNPVSTLTFGSGTGIASLTTYQANNQTFLLAVGDTSTAGEVSVQSFLVNTDGSLTAGTSQTLATSVGLRSVVMVPTSTATTPQAAIILGDSNGSNNLFSVPVDPTGALQTPQAFSSGIAGHPTSLFPGQGDLLFATSDAGLVPTIVDSSGQLTLGKLTGTDTGGSLCGLLLQTQ